jgi:hypothetical protein
MRRREREKIVVSGESLTVAEGQSRAILQTGSKGYIHTVQYA